MRYRQTGPLPSVVTGVNRPKTRMQQLDMKLVTMLFAQ
ncbi:unnamed protein product, partial [Didymodactylos carnosus]